MRSLAEKSDATKRILILLFMFVSFYACVRVLVYMFISGCVMPGVCLREREKMKGDLRELVPLNEIQVEAESKNFQKI